MSTTWDASRRAVARLFRVDEEDVKLVEVKIDADQFIAKGIFQRVGSDPEICRVEFTIAAPTRAVDKVAGATK